ncbi:molecular chaperone [Shewanella sp. A3A]|nr:molecular chaperone [Shewanella ferrihydritica]
MKSLCFFLLLLLPLSTWAFEISSTRVVFHQNDEQVVYRVSNNNGGIPYLVQNWISDAETTKPTEAFISTPPLLNLAINSEQAFRIIHDSSKKLPGDRESIFFLNIFATPAMSNDGKSKVVLNSQYRIKLIYRPEGLNDKDAFDVFRRLNVVQRDQRIEVHNPTAYFINIARFFVNETVVNIPEDMKTLSPFGVSQFEFKEKAKSYRMIFVSDKGFFVKTDSENL